MQRSWEGTSQNLGSISLCRHSRPPGEGEAAPLRTVGHTRLPECPCITEGQAGPGQGRQPDAKVSCSPTGEGPMEAPDRSPCGVRARALRSLCRHCWPGAASPHRLWSGTFLVRLLATETAPGETPCESGVTHSQRPGRARAGPTPLAETHPCPRSWEGTAQNLGQISFSQLTPSQGLSGQATLSLP